MTTLLDLIIKEEKEGHLSSASTQNIRKLLAQATSSFEERVIAELVAEGAWEELNNRFFTTLAFGTGGLRGKTIGAHVTKVEEGVKRPDGRPEFACVGTNAVNNYNIVRATRGLVTYVSQWHQKQQRSGRSKICISYDTRFFSREFAELAAKVITEHGCDALMFEAPRSTPELSFAVRHCEATAGINITASHNPPQYNGYKVYFEDGGQIIEPHASAIIQLVESMEGESYEPLPKEQQGEIVLLGQEIDEAYMKRLETLVLHPSLMKQKPALKVVYTPLHGVGGVIILPMLHRLGVECLPVVSQMLPDGLFSTVKSPNPENAEALTLGMELANKEGAHLVLATDPDDDRMGVAARNADGELQLLTGNQIGALMVWYRLTQLFASGILNKKNRGGAVIIKSLVTTDLQKVIAEKFGVRCVETLTGFKYIGAKLCSYEEQLPMELQVVYRTLSEAETREARLEHSSYFVFGGEESYGYSMGDFVRDKDGNAAVVCLSEVAAYAASQKITLPELLDRIYGEYGFYLERGESLTLEGAEGAAQMALLMSSYTITNPFTIIDGARVLSLRNFATEKIHDSEGELLPAEAMLMIELEEGLRVVIRPSGTEPKIKFYLFASKQPDAKTRRLSKLACADEVQGVDGAQKLSVQQLLDASSTGATKQFAAEVEFRKKSTFSPEELKAAKLHLTTRLEKLWQWLKNDALSRCIANKNSVPAGAVSEVK